MNNDIIVDSAILNIKDTLENGQFFRYSQLGGVYTVRTLDKVAILYERGDKVIIENEDKAYFHNFFDLDTDYAAIKQSLYTLPLMKDAIDHAPALRILRQDAFETVINFIISANNHIQRIKAIIERLCAGGAFPTLTALAARPIEFYRSLGAGYRDNYLYNTAQILGNNHAIINSIRDMDTPAAIKALTALSGVGPKVADCILLFGYYRMDTFPVDTWIKKVYKDIYGDVSNTSVMRSKLISTYGDLSGYAQQYLFYNKRG